jgi:hypothetical protein
MPIRMSKISKEELKEAYIKLKSHIYYDTTELYQRRKLAEFETGLLDDDYLFSQKKTPYANGIFNLNVKLEDKFDKIVEWVNNHKKESTFEQFLDDIKLIYLPKKFKKTDDGDTFLSNQRVQDNYEIERVTVFADIPIELHLVTILWLTQYGYKLDVKLDESCVGNRLVLNKSKDRIVKGSGLFKPYFSQYQKWRDQSVEEAQRKLQSGSKVAFINLDLKDYFYSVRINFEEIEKVIFGESGYKGGSNIHDIFKEFHVRFTKKLAEKKYPNKFIENIPLGNVVLPIGIASSYVLANYYLNDFDNRIRKLIPQVYYSRYVDDILIVIENPDFDFHKNEKCESVRFNFKKYYEKEKSKEKITFAKTEEEYFNKYIVSKTERFILETLYPLVKLVDFPDELKTIKVNDKVECCSVKNEKKIFKITCLEGAFFQGDKTLLYYFDNEESTAVIDKLKQELEERTSEFRDFPEDGMGDGSFDEQAYHLVFDGTEGKIRTLKDYKENRYGLSVFLANRIFAALRRSKKVDKKETEKLLKLFKGLNNLEHFRLWEKVFTFFLVNEDQEGFILFYKHTLEQIQKLNKTTKIQDSEITYNDVANSLMQYFDISLEMPLALHPEFIKKDTKPYKDLEIFHNTYKNEVSFWNNITLTKPGSFYIYKFRMCNLIRHHYVAHPLLNYTKASGWSPLNLVDRNLPTSQKSIDKLEFSDEKKELSPRLVKFWECCIAVTTNKLLKNSNDFIVGGDERYQYTSILNDSKKDEDFILNEAFKLYSEINASHFTSDSPNITDFFRRVHKNITPTNGENEVEINELHINTNERFEEKPSISIANTQVKLSNIETSVKGKPNLGNQRYLTFAKLLKESRKEGANIFLLPEFSVPYEFVSSLAKYSEKNQMAIIAGLEHWKVDDVCYNFIVSIIPVKVNGVNDAIVLYRLKNHYAHVEELIIRGYGYKVPKPKPYRYDLINWRNLYFTSFYCFELADTFHRSIFRSKIDLLIASEWNKDTPYFSNIVEALSRDLHCYIAQVNTSQFGDSRLTQPSESARKDLMKLKGGKNDTVIVEDLNINALREFQLKYFERIKADQDDSFKPVPPDWNRKDVNNRIDNKNIFLKDKDDEE